MKKIYYLLLLALPLVLQSCFKDDDDIYDKSASQRMEERLVHDQQVLMGATNGWIMEYFPEKKQDSFALAKINSKNRATLFATHPSISARIERLRDM